MKFIVFGEDWQSHPSSTQHLFKQLSKQHQVIWINSIGMRKPTFRLIDVKRVFNKLKSLFLSKRTGSNAKTTNTSQNINLTYKIEFHKSLFKMKARICNTVSITGITCVNAIINKITIARYISEG